MNTPPTPRAITFRPSPELRSRIESFAREHRWSLNAAVEWLVTETLDEHHRRAVARKHIGEETAPRTYRTASGQRTPSARLTRAIDWIDADHNPDTP